ncbi:MAG: hypothetical protein E7Z80_08905 [Methanobrevibacter thaueri]|nr:hypothetical protein [Methanobrevibacter thaueri]
MAIQMEFGIDETGPWGWRGRITGRYRRIQLFDKKGELLSEVIEENPLYQPDVKMALPDGKDVIY